MTFIKVISSTDLNWNIFCLFLFFYHKRNAHVYGPLRSFMCWIQYQCLHYTTHQTGTDSAPLLIHTVLTALHSFHISLCNSLIPKLVIQSSSQNFTHKVTVQRIKVCFKFMHICSNKYSHSLLSTLKYLWQQLQPQSLFLLFFLSIVLQACLTYFFFLTVYSNLCRTSHPIQLDGACVCTAIFKSVLSW